MLRKLFCLLTYANVCPLLSPQCRTLLPPLLQLPRGPSNKDCLITNCRMYVRTYVHAVTNNCVTQFIVTSFMSHAVSTRVLHYTIYIHLLLNCMLVVLCCPVLQKYNGCNGNEVNSQYFYDAYNEAIAIHTHNG